MRAQILIEDAEGGARATCFLEGGFQPDSAAHQACRWLLDQMDRFADAKPEGPAEWVTAEQAEKVLRGDKPEGSTITVVPAAG